MNKGKIWFAAILLFCFMFPADARAYIDPGAGAAFITAVLGLIGAAGFMFSKYYAKLKSLFSRKKDDRKNGGS